MSIILMEDIHLGDYNILFILKFLFFNRNIIPITIKEGETKLTDVL